MVKATGCGGCALVLVVLALAACGGGDRQDEGAPAPATTESSPAAGSTAAVAADTTASTEETPGEAAATEPEVAWAGRVIDWAVLVGSAVEFVQANAEGLAKGKAPPAKAREPVANALRALADCRPFTQKEVGKPPSERLESVLFAVDSACQHYSAGAVAALDLLEGAGSHSPALAGEWEETWGKGDELISSVAEELRDFQPANTRTLRERAGETRASRVEPEFGAVASKHIESDVEVRCWSTRDWKVLLDEMKTFTRGRIREGTIGFAGYGDHRVNLSPEICDGLVALKYTGARPQTGKPLALVAIAVETLMHEAQHVRGVWNEPGAECYGMQMLREAARDLGAPKAYADRLAEVYWEELYELLPETYQSPECRDGGAMDANPNTSVWP